MLSYILALIVLSVLVVQGSCSMGTIYFIVVLYVRLTQISSFLLFLSGSTCSVRETGLSLTKPSTGTVALDGRQGHGEGRGQQHGEGMEWHSDGSEGEFTMLMSLSGERGRERERKRQWTAAAASHLYCIHPDSHADLFHSNSTLLFSA
jgi:hypothetical protein